MPLISVVIPVYNGEKTIQETVTSVLNQTFSDLELIIIDDSSQDTTLEILKQIQDQRLTVLSYPNSGPSASRNRGISASKGEYISFLDADDLWTSQKLEAQLDALRANPQAALAYSWTNFIGESGQFLHAGGRPTWSGKVYEKLLTHFFLESGSNFLIRNQVLEEVGRFDESLHTAEDWDLCLRVAARYEFVAVPQAQILYRQSIHSLSSSVVKQKEAFIKVINLAFERAPESLHYLKKQSVANLYQYLTFKALQGSPSRFSSLLAVQYLWRAISADPAFLKQRTRLVSIICLKILVSILLPSSQAQKLLEVVKGSLGSQTK